MMEDLWVLYCGESAPPNFDFLGHPSSCTNHLLIICLDIVLLAMLLFTMFHKSLSSKLAHIPARFLGFSRLQIVSAIVNGCLGFVYLCLGTWFLVQKLRGSGSALPLNWWLLTLFQGITWLVVSLSPSFGKQLPRKPSILLSILAFLFPGIVCALSLYFVSRVMAELADGLSGWFRAFVHDHYTYSHLSWTKCALGISKVIKGWDQGILGGYGIPPMLAGGKRSLKIPAELAYGARGAGCRGGNGDPWRAWKEDALKAMEKEQYYVALLLDSLLFFWRWLELGFSTQLLGYLVW